MRLFGFLLLFCLAALAASYRERWEREVDDLIHFMKEMPDAYELNEVEDDIKTELGKKLKEKLQDILNKIKEAIDKKKELKEDFLQKVKELKEKLKDLHIDLSGKAKELLEKVKNKLKDYFKDLLDSLTGKEERAINYAMEIAERVHSIKGTLENVLKMINENVSLEKLKQYLKDRPPSKITDTLFKLIENLDESEALKTLRDFINKLLGRNRDVRSFKEKWEQLKEFFKDLKLKEKFKDFAEWLKEKVEKGLDVAKGKVSTMQEIAKKIIEDSKQISKEVAVEALEFLRPYKEDLGDMWNDLKEKVKEVMKRKD